MKRLNFFLVLGLLASTTSLPAAGSKPAPKVIVVGSDADSDTEKPSFADRYVEFLNYLSPGQDVPKDFADKLKSLFSAHCIKIINGVVCKHLGWVSQQLEKAKAEFGAHTIEVGDIVPCKENNRSVIHFALTDYADQSDEQLATLGKKRTTYIVITILTCNEQGLITEIKEVCTEKGA